jgi:pyruvate kinase
MALVWGAHSVHSQDIRSYEEMVSVATSIARAQEVARRGDALVVVAGIPFGQTGSTNNLRVVRVE